MTPLAGQDQCDGFAVRRSVGTYGRAEPVAPIDTQGAAMFCAGRCLHFPEREKP